MSAEGAPGVSDTESSLRRFQVVSLAAGIAAGIPFLWVLWDLWTGTINPLRVNGSDATPVYDAQTRAIMHGRLWLPRGRIGPLAFVHDGHQYTYFGIFPSLLRVPVFVFTHSLDGRFTSLSLLGAWIVTAVFSSLLLWRLRVVLRGDALLEWSEATACGVLLFSILAGSVLVYLASIPDVYSEDMSWSVALACASVFALLGVVERPSWGRICVCAAFILLTDLNRITTGYAAIAAALLLAGWFALGRAGSDRRRWAVPMAAAGLVPLAVGCAINQAKFGVLFGIPYVDELLIRSSGAERINGGHFLDLRFLPSTLQTYVSPSNFRVSSVFPYITLADVPSDLSHDGRLFYLSPTASVVLSMPVLVVAGLFGVITAFTPHRPRVFEALRILLVTSALTAGVILIYGWIVERYEADFLPLLLLAAMIGIVELFRWLPGWSRLARRSAYVSVCVLALFGLWTNLGLAITPNPNWDRTQLTHYVDAQRALSDLTGHPLDHSVVVGDHFPLKAPRGTLFVLGRCTELFIADESLPATDSFPTTIWLPIEQAPRTPICHSLVAQRMSAERH